MVATLTRLPWLEDGNDINKKFWRVSGAACLLRVMMRSPGESLDALFSKLRSDYPASMFQLGAYTVGTAKARPIDGSPAHLMRHAPMQLREALNNRIPEDTEVSKQCSVHKISKNILQNRTVVFL